MKKSFSCMLVFWLAMIQLASAGDYTLIVGEGTEVCDACKRNLERMTEHPACERDYSSHLGLGSPEWKPFDVPGHLGAMERVLTYLATGHEFAEDRYIMGEDQFEDTIRRIGTKEEPWAYWAEIDINNDGKLEPVLKLHSAFCNLRYDGSIGRAYSAPIVVLKEMIEVLLLGRPFIAVVAIPAVALVALANALRFWVIASLGVQWNVRVVASTPALGVVTGGPYRFVRHPNYVAVFVELAALPPGARRVPDGGSGGAAACPGVASSHRSGRIRAAGGRSYRRAFDRKPRFIPWPWPTS